MVNMTISLPDELSEKMKEFSEIKWSEVARKAIQKRIEDLEEMEKIASKSNLTKDDVEEIGKKIKSSVSKKFDEGGTRQ